MWEYEKKSGNLFNDPRNPSKSKNNVHILEFWFKWSIIGTGKDDICDVKSTIGV